MAVCKGDFTWLAGVVRDRCYMRCYTVSWNGVRPVGFGRIDGVGEVVAPTGRHRIAARVRFSVTGFGVSEFRRERDGGIQRAAQAVALSERSTDRNGEGAAVTRRVWLRRTSRSLCCGPSANWRSPFA